MLQSLSFTERNSSKKSSILKADKTIAVECEVIYNYAQVSLSTRYNSSTALLLCFAALPSVFPHQPLESHELLPNIVCAGHALLVGFGLHVHVVGQCRELSKPFGRERFLRGLQFFDASLRCVLSVFAIR